MVEKKLKWSREECERRYVQGDRIGQRELSHLSGRAESIIAHWSRKDGWVGKREQYQRKLREQIEEKTLEKQSSQISDDLATIAKSHYEANKVFKELAVAYGKAVQRLLKDAEEQGSDAVLRILEQINPTSINFWSLVLDRSIKGEATATGVQLQVNPDAAVSTLEKLGYEVRESGYLEVLEGGAGGEDERSFA